VVLLGAELIGEPGGVDHGALGLLLGILGLRQHLVDLGLEGVDVALHGTLLVHGAGVDGLHLVDGVPGVGQLLVDLALGSLGRIQKGPGLLDLAAEGIGFPVGNANSLRDLLPGASLILEGLDGLSQLTLVPLDGLLALGVGLVGVVKSDLQLVDVRLQLLLDAESLGLGALLSLQGSAERVHGALVVLAEIYFK
jgi:hypothetical protein